MLVPMKVILDEAYAGRYGVPAFPGFNEIQIRAGIEAAVQANSPVIFLTMNRGDPAFTNNIVRQMADRVDVNVALCLDHSRSFEDSVLGIRNGCTAIMADRSTDSFEDNVAQCKLLAEIAHAAGVSIEAELGHVGQANNYAVDGVTALTDPAQAKRFLDETGVDALAVAIGTAHGAYSGIPKLDFDRLRDIDAACGKPLVLHGGSGSGDDNIHKACTMGIAKVNIVTDVIAATVKAAKEGDFTGRAGHMFYSVLIQAIKECELHLFEVTGSVGKAKGPKVRGGIPSTQFSTEE